MGLIEAYIDRTWAAPFVWGENDCALWAASLWKELTGRDPAAGLRGTYATAFECRQVVQEAGGLENLCRKLMAGEAEGAGDGIAVISAGRQNLCGVHFGGSVICKMETGIKMIAKPRTLAQWAL